MTMVVGRHAGYIPATKVGVHTDDVVAEHWRQRVCCRCGIIEIAPERQATAERKAGIVSYPDYRCVDCKNIRFFR